MPNHFRILQSTRVIENYLSRDKFMIEKLGDSYGTELYDKKIKQHNELVVAVNGLYGELVDTGGQPLFDLLPLWGFPTDAAYDAPDNSAYNVVAEAAVTGAPIVEETPETVLDANFGTTEASDDVSDDEPDEQADEDEPEEEHEHELGDDEPTDGLNEEEHDTDGLGDLGDQDEPEEDVAERGQTAAGEILDEYRNTSEHDVSTYNPEEHAPVDVLATAHVMTHSADNVRINEDPLQMASVTTQSEIAGNESEGVDIPMNQFAPGASRRTRTQGYDYDALVNEHARNLGVVTDQTPETADEPVTASVPANNGYVAEEQGQEEEETFAPDDASFVTRDDLSKHDE